MHIRIRLVHDSVTPHLKKLQVAFKKPIQITVSGPLGRPLFLRPLWPPKSLALSPLLEARRRAFLARFPHFKNHPAYLPRPTAFACAQGKHALRAEAQKRLNDL